MAGSLLLYQCYTDRNIPCWPRCSATRRPGSPAPGLLDGPFPRQDSREGRRTSNPPCVLKSGSVRAAHPGTRGMSGTKGLWRMTSSATVSRGSSVTPA